MSDAYATAPVPLETRSSRRRSTRSASTPAGRSAPVSPTSSAVPTRLAIQMESVIAKAISGKTNMLIRVPSSLTVWPIQSTEKSWLRASAR